jgi:hypothetical protein
MSSLELRPNGYVRFKSLLVRRLLKFNYLLTYGVSRLAFTNFDRKKIFFRENHAKIVYASVIREQFYDFCHKWRFFLQNAGNFCKNWIIALFCI